jgi:hypothetical protein
MDKTMPMLLAVQARLIVLLNLSTLDVTTRIGKVKAANNILETFDPIMGDLQDQKLLTKAWLIELMSYEWAAINRGQFPLSMDTALLCVELLQTAHDFMCSAAVHLSLIEEMRHRVDGIGTVSPEELGAYFGTVVELHMCLQGTIMGLRKLNALVRRECRTICSVHDMPQESVDPPTATVLDHAVDALCWVGCYTRSRERTELYCKLSGWRCGSLGVKAFPFDKYFDCLDWSQAERGRFRLGLFHILYFTDAYLHRHGKQC